MDSRTIIERLGGPSEVSRLCGSDVTPQAVSQWQDRRIPKGWLRFLETIRPDVFKDAKRPAKAKA